MRKDRSNIWVALAYLGIVMLVFGTALWPADGMMIYGDDIHRAYYFFREFFAHWISRGVFPWWNPYINGGEPFVANPIVNIWYPPTWMFVFLPLNIAYSWHMALHVWWACLGMFLFLKQIGPIGHIRPIRPISVFVGGLLFGLSGFFMARTFAGHVDVVAAASWMPWVVGAFYRLVVAPGDGNFLDPLLARTSVFRFFRQHSAVKVPSVLELGKRSAKISSPFASRLFLLASVVFAMQLLAGYQTMAFMTVIIVGVVTMFHSYIERSWRPMVLAGLAGATGVALAAVQILPVQEFFRQSIRTYPFPYSWISYGSITWQSLVQLFNPFYFGNQFTYHGPPPNFIEHSMYVGVGGVVLAVIGVMFLLNKSLRLPRSLRSLNTEGVRFLPAQLVGFCLIFIVFFGLWISLGPNAPFDLQKLLWQIVPMYRYLRIPPRHLVLVVFGLAGLAGIGMEEFLHRLPRSLRGLRYLITGIIVVEMVLFGRSFIQLKEVPESRHDKALISLLQADTQPYRVFQNFGVWLKARDVLDFDSAMAYGIYSATGYDPSILRPYYEYVAQGAGTRGEKAVLAADVQVPYLGVQSAETLDFLNIKYIMVPQGYDPFAASNRYRLVKKDEVTDWRLYENTTAKERFFFAQPNGGSVRVTSFTPNEVQISVESLHDQSLYSSEVNYPGWRAYIDGKRVDITVSNGAFRTLFVPVGKHTIVYRYVPTIFVLGGGISLLTLGALLFFMKYQRSKTIQHEQ